MSFWYLAQWFYTHHHAHVIQQKYTELQSQSSWPLNVCCQWIISQPYVNTRKKISCYILIVKTIYEGWHLFKCYFIKWLLKVYMRHLCRVYVEYFYVFLCLYWILLYNMDFACRCYTGNVPNPSLFHKMEALNTYIHNKTMQHLCLRPTLTQPPLRRVCKWSAAESVSGTAGCWWTVLCYERWLESEPNHADMILAGVPFIPTWIKDWRLDSHSEDT